MKGFIAGLLLTSSLFASNDLAHRPRSFGEAVFVDFRSAVYDITYDLNKSKATVLATIQFYAPEAGRPVFDLVSAPTSVSLDGKPVTAEEKSTPSSETTVRVVNQKVSVGMHTLKVEVPLTEMVKFENGLVKSAFWTSDLALREFLELYMPASFEYDQVKMIFNVKFIGATKTQVLYTNGDVEAFASGDYRITYPEHFNASSVYFHLTSPSEVKEIRYTLKSIDGREVPAVVYGASLSQVQKVKDKATAVFHELEADYGAWPHQQLIIYNAGLGGMEYCGATITEFRAVGHEMFHSYFARGVMPANGNAGWLDEALASWRDEGYQRSSSLSGSSMMSNHPYYTRSTDRDAYSFGESFMRFVDGKLSHKGGLKPFLRHMISEKTFAPLFVQEFIKELESFTGVDFELDFKRYTMGTRPYSGRIKDGFESMHHKMSLEELRKLL